jgi:hypothetical protein
METDEARFLDCPFADAQGPLGMTGKEAAARCGIEAI